jgi:hypothetical protein
MLTPIVCVGTTVADTVETLQAELARLFKLMTEARASGDEALADLLAQQAARYLMRIADLRASPSPAQEPQPAAQQQQQVQPKDEE